ncbi:MAG TPA: ATP-binding protein [Bdellovibrionales bacterium]|nr:ATP-binding protein [Bdellovibrionales bacterium]
MLQTWELLTAPSPKITNPDESRTAFYLASVLLLYIGILTVMIELSAVVSPSTVSETSHHIGHMAILSYLGFYVLSRTRHYKWAAYGFPMFIYIAIFLTTYFDRKTNVIHAAYMWLSIATFVCSIVLPLKQATIYCAMTFVGIIAFAFWMPETHFRPLIVDVPPLLMLSVLILTVAALRSRAERSLKEAKDEAERANLAKSRFLAAMSHEIRSPLGVVLGFTDILSQNDITPEERRRFRDMVSRNGSHLLSLINEVLDLSKVEAGRLEVRTARVNIKEELFALVGQHQTVAEKKGVRVLLSVDETCPNFIETDPLRLRQALHNLLSNAVKFTERGDIAVRMKSAGDQVVFTVQDSGIGIAPESQAKLFEPFVQENGRKFGGAGLGLALSKKLAKLMGGDLRLEWSEPGAGSRFELRVPNHSPQARPQS